ncbi:hypothetical protein [Phyllobacterium zundukense]|uniref:Uncharacterized protein n=1 Tax=Phyllobacterium zundukense TaxID=1867719 RepID=A0ACD4D3I3_9HYPH|nr:hypothetical protein [Phyllobacterium zundukense]UXN60380.1 hypothetical protein N8E88_28425 [Phyllobacterium zundukense]
MEVAMTPASSKTDSEAYELASTTADAQRAKLPDWQRKQISDADMQTGETWFVWGFYGAMTDDIERRKRLLAAYVNTKFVDRKNSQQVFDEISKATQEGNRLFDAISAAGGQAYREGGDGHLANIATIFLNVSRNH